MTPKPQLSLFGDPAPAPSDGAVYAAVSQGLGAPPGPATPAPGAGDPTGGATPPGGPGSAPEGGAPVAAAGAAPVPGQGGPVAAPAGAAGAVTPPAAGTPPGGPGSAPAGGAPTGYHPDDAHGPAAAAAFAGKTLSPDGARRMLAVAAADAAEAVRDMTLMLHAPASEYRNVRLAQARQNLFLSASRIEWALKGEEIPARTSPAPTSRRRSL